MERILDLLCTMTVYNEDTSDLNNVCMYNKYETVVYAQASYTAAVLKLYRKQYCSIFPPSIADRVKH